MSVLAGLLQGIVEHPLEEDRYLVLADWLEENDDPRRAELLRLHRQLLATCCEPDKYLQRTCQRARWQARMVELLEQGVQPCVPQQTLAPYSGVDITFSFIPPGEFLMGRPLSENQHRVTLTKGFFLGVTPVTQGQWRVVMNTSRCDFKGLDRPMENVSWKDCQQFCKRLSQLEGKTIRLPSEAEWEYACRAGTTTSYFFGETVATNQANYRHLGSLSGDGSDTTPVRSFPANAWGLFDMHGNVWEWCLDLQRTGNGRALRGGSFNCDNVMCRASSCVFGRPGSRATSFGFRVCFTLD